MFTLYLQVASNVIAYVIFWLLLGFDETPVDSSSSNNSPGNYSAGLSPGAFSSNDAEKFQNLALICIAIGLALAIAFQLGVKDPKMPHSKINETSSVPNLKKNQGKALEPLMHELLQRHMMSPLCMTQGYRLRMIW